MSGPGPASYLARDTRHAATPLGGTYIRESDGGPACLTDAGDYPVRAECKICHGPIRLAELLQWDWAHVPAQVPA